MPLLRWQGSKRSNRVPTADERRNAATPLVGLDAQKASMVQPILQKDADRQGLSTPRRCRSMVPEVRSAWFDLTPGQRDHYGRSSPSQRGLSMGSLVKKRRKKMSKHKYRKRIKANRHKRKK